MNKRSHQEKILSKKSVTRVCFYFGPSLPSYQSIEPECLLAGYNRRASALCISKNRELLCNPGFFYRVHQHTYTKHGYGKQGGKGWVESWEGVWRSLAGSQCFVYSQGLRTFLEAWLSPFIAGVIKVIKLKILLEKNMFKLRKEKKHFERSTETKDQ